MLSMRVWDTGVASACDLNPSKVVVDGGTEMHRAVRALALGQKTFSRPRAKTEPRIFVLVRRGFVW